MDAPQSRAEVQPIVDALQHMDALLDVRWNPRVLCVRNGQFDAFGVPLPAIWDGRWQVVRAKTPHVKTAGDALSEDDWAVIYDVRGPKDEYKPVGWWLVDYLQRWDSAQAHFRDELEKERAEDERIADALIAGDVAGDREIAEAMAFTLKHEGGRTQWFGQGFDVEGIGRRARGAMAPPGGEAALLERTHQSPE